MIEDVIWLTENPDLSHVFPLFEKLKVLPVTD